MVNKLENFPPPERKVDIAVYKFVDQTGQRKPTDAGASFSMAVTQGAGTWLVQALKTAGKGEWFTVVERAIRRTVKRNYRNELRRKRPSWSTRLTFAGLLIEGSIVGYDSNVASGGVGARYLGVGIQVEYRRDMVSVGLRLISVQTGEVYLQ